ncbi:BirA family transcriptional regulator, biotin operon repressor / biotin-[acetyl-CoA-carboxylase] ligase [Tessaracoccus bendigoensis DSM 12906]|uniref:biotin--[biotin carboxyl-carrier protein] ligase n=1 Tax=Tessaracoccus bendigoensis DSM 12906 TaxID=1123357 RepID=A0A1M6GYA6_9ACTN|nr:biotin--[acetyl-CoA-carboxylase] ligase [Tessaracoccus bendigoensis]SHJ14845.1 BirA family transcriptional regulator, biotin operon repressor / biotin-[acetyl-CoA-carboxylase] ligase [Tessaracoccus bendigoensis DSM 12906]
MNIEVPDARSIAERLPRDTVFRRVEVLASTGSTNADLAARARDGETEGTALIAMEQTAGRGRLDRQWVSPPGMSISMSLLLAPRPDLTQWGWLSILAGMAVSSALTSVAPDPSAVTLKWPNDVLIGGRKVCGILSERIERVDGARAVIGIGINVGLTREQLPVPNATSLALEGFPTHPEPLVAGVLGHFDRYYRSWSLRGSLRDEYEERCASIGAPLTVVLDATHSVSGTGRGVDEYGRLQVATASGIETFAVGDVVHARLVG